jgi:hypothetical protein
VEVFHDSIAGLGRIGKTLLTTTGITLKTSSLLHIGRSNSMASYIMSFHESTLHNLSQPLILFKISRNDIA